MTYTKRTWSTGDEITADELNNVEQGVADAHTLVATAQSTADAVTATAATLPTTAYVDSTVNNAVNAAVAPLVTTTALNAAVAPLATTTYVDSAVAGVSVSLANLPAGSTLTVDKDPTNGWPARPTARADLTVAWRGPDPSPAIVSSGTAGMLNNVDYRLVTT